MIKMLCDNCGKNIDKYNYSRITRIVSTSCCAPISDYICEEHYEFCRDCSEKIMDLIRQQSKSWMPPITISVDFRKMKDETGVQDGKEA